MYELNEHKICQLYTEKRIEPKLTHFFHNNLLFWCIHVTLDKEREILYGLWRLNCMLFSQSYQKFMPLKHQHVVLVRLASVLPKRKNKLMTHCYFWVRQIVTSGH